MKNMAYGAVCVLLETLTLFLARRFFPHEDGGDKFLRNITSNKTDMAPHPRRQPCSRVPEFSSRHPKVSFV
jgi:hypothetical protein